MQTFLPYQDFMCCAKVLDRQRLGNQRVENLQIINTLVYGGGWNNHPAVKMWKGYEKALFFYQFYICGEWVFRGYNDTCLDKTRDTVGKKCLDRVALEMPPWWGNPRLHLSHRSRLVCKFPEHYRKFWPDIDDDFDYYWPV